MGLIDSFLAFTKNPTVERAYKTFIEATAAQTALYTTVVPHPPNVQTSAAVSVGSTVLAILWNSLLTAVSNRQAAKLTALADAIDKAVAQRLALQAAAQKQVITPVQIPSA